MTTFSVPITTLGTSNGMSSKKDMSLTTPSKICVTVINNYYQSLVAGVIASKNKILKKNGHQGELLDP